MLGQQGDPPASPALPGPSCSSTLPNVRIPALGGFLGSLQAQQPSPTSAGRQGLAPHAVLAVPGGAVDGGLPVQGHARVAGVGHGSAIVELVLQPPRVLPVGDVGWGLTGDACRVQNEVCQSYSSTTRAPGVPSVRHKLLF